jgi:hypothetical protein
MKNNKRHYVLRNFNVFSEACEHKQENKHTHT